MEKFANLPTPVKGGVVAGGGIGLVTTGMFMGAENWWRFLLILVALLAVCLGGYFLMRAWKRKKHAARMSGELQQHSSASPRAIADPGARARLDDLRKKFEQGVQEYRSRGKDLYTLPWYVIVGEPGSGKTEAIRHSNVGFPPGMQDEFQGVGGTINMNWWFTNNAVLLDTAGRLMFEEVKPGEQSEWKEFLTLLKKNRPNCPINGLLLVIPSESLIKDSADDIARKAGKIAQQLDVIQRVLDVRFPVYVVVTKCDKINGYREFFDGLTDPQLQHQMMGWSNPDPLDTAFRPDQVDQHLDKVSQRLRRRRMGSLRDPVPEAAGGRRADEVDSLYSLPHSLELLAPRLRRYLETIFVAGEWSAKPLFLRGIYFTSSMREGAALDEELAKAIGVGVEDLGEDKSWARDRAYFLRDLFLEKVFREKGLVTRATNTTRMLRSRQLALYGAGSAALVLFIAVAWIGMADLRNSVTGVSGRWAAIAKPGWQNRTWNQSIVPLTGTGYEDKLRDRITFENASRSIGDIHWELYQHAAKRPQRTLIFPGLSGSFYTSSRRAQQIVFETGVLRPLIEATRKKMERDLARDPAQDHLPAALAALIQLEGDIALRAHEESSQDLTKPEAEQLLASLMSFVAGAEQRPSAKLVDTMVATYATDDKERGWPSPWLGSQTNKLSNDRTLQAGLTQLEKYALRSIQSRLEGWKQASNLVQAVRQFQARESALFAAISPGSGDYPLQPLAELGRVATNIDEQVKVATNILFQPALSFSNAYHQFNSVVLSNPDKPVLPAREASRKALASVTNEFLRDIDRRLIEMRRQVTEQAEKTVKLEEAQVINQLDEKYLIDKTYARRWELYRDAHQAAVASPPGEGLIGSRGELLSKRLDDHKRRREQAFLYAGPLQTNAQQTLRALWTKADALQREKFMEAYLVAATNTLKPKIRFPVSREVTGLAMDVKSLSDLKRQLEEMRKDLESAPFQGTPFKESSQWQNVSNRIIAYHALAAGLLDQALEPVSCVVSLAPSKEAEREKRDKWRDHWRKIWVVPSGNKERQIVRSFPTDFEKLGSFAVDGPLTFTLENNDNERLNITVAEQWGFIKLLFENHERAQRAGNSWTLELPTRKEGNAAGAIALKLDFSTVLPEIKDWPPAF